MINSQLPLGSIVGPKGEQGDQGSDIRGPKLTPKEVPALLLLDPDYWLGKKEN